MKKIIASFTVIVYLAFSCGVMVNLHYCMDRYDSFRLYKTSGDLCSNCGMNARDHGCCHDVVKIVKLQDDHQTSSISFAFKNIEATQAVPSEFFFPVLENKDPGDGITDDSPPIIPTVDIQVQNCVFRI